ncbi:MAG: DUF3078 domain-containing protein [Bacteroidales bacterium]
MKKAFLFSILLLSGALAAQESPDTTKFWKTGGDLSLTFSQVSLTNWAAGGESSFSGNGLLNVSADYKKDKNIWDNDLIMGYGLMKQGEGEWIKTDDRIEMNSKYGYRAKNNWYYSAMLGFKSQFTPGYKDNHPDSAKTSGFLSPAYITAGVGMSYEPNENLSIYISPLTDRVTIISDTLLSERYGLDAGEKVRNQIGGLFRGMFKCTIIENVDFQTNLELFSDYQNKPQNIDVTWDVLINMKVNKYLSANLSTSLIYDHDINFAAGNDPVHRPRTQFKEVFGAGLALKF